MSTLSLEPLLRAPPPTTAANDDGITNGQDEHGQDSLAARLQRLWQERGDFSKLSIEQLEADEDGEDVGQEAKGVEEVGLDASKDDQGGDGEDATAAVEEQAMSQTELWELKSGMLQGLDLARTDITSALDLLQLLLGPLNALMPAVPDEALALPPGSMSASALHTPVPAPPEPMLVRNAGLALATKVKALGTASDLLRSANKRLLRTTAKSQTEWTDLLRLKRSGQWKIEPRPAHVPQASTFHAAYAVNVPVERMAKDICVFCGIDEARYHWRQAGLVRFDNGNEEKGKSRERLDIPERLEGRRRLCIEVETSSGTETGTPSYWPSVETFDEDDLHSHLVQVQQELFEEEIFAELIREARSQPFGITATRNSLEIRHDASFRISLSMRGIDEVQSHKDTNGSGASHNYPLPHLLAIIARQTMLRIYRDRRKPQVQPAEAYSKTSTSVRDQPSLNVTSGLRDVVLYYLHAQRLRNLLHDATAALRGCGAFDSTDVHLAFSPLLIHPDALVEQLDPRRLGGSACLSMASQHLNITFSGGFDTVIHLPARDIPISQWNDLTVLLQRILQAAILKQLEVTMKEECMPAQGWDVLPVPKTVSKNTQALARKLASHQEDGARQDNVLAFVSILPRVSINAFEPFETLVSLTATASSRKDDNVIRKTFTSTHGTEVAAVKQWLSSQLETL